LRGVPSNEAIAAKAECARGTVGGALKMLEWAGVLTWVHRIARIQVRERDLFGRWASRWRVIRTSNAYVFRDPQQRPEGVPASKSENRLAQSLTAALIDPDSLLRGRHPIRANPAFARVRPLAARLDAPEVRRKDLRRWSQPRRMGGIPPRRGCRAGCLSRDCAHRR
jgi:hypothetical protein